MSLPAIEELRFVQTEDGYVRTIQVMWLDREPSTFEITVAVLVDDRGLIQAEYAVDSTGGLLPHSIGFGGSTVAEARALARAFDRAADKVAVRQILAGA